MRASLIWHIYAGFYLTVNGLAPNERFFNERNAFTLNNSNKT